MTIRKTAFLIFFSLLSITNAFAGKEDWNGNFTINDALGSANHVLHTPTSVSYLCFCAGKCIELHKGTSINGIEIKEDVHLCTNSDVETFTAEVAKLGSILDRKITLGKTYSN